MKMSYTDTELDEKAKTIQQVPVWSRLQSESARGTGLTGSSNRTPRKPDAHRHSRRDKTRLLSYYDR